MIFLQVRLIIVVCFSQVDSFINDEKRNMVENLKSRTYINELYKEKSKKYLER